MLKNQLSNIKLNKNYEINSISSNKYLFHSQYLKSNHRKKSPYKPNRKSSGKNFNKTKFKSKKLKKNQTKLHKITSNLTSFNPNIFQNNASNDQISPDTHSMIRDYLYISILGLLCFFPTGIFALTRSMQSLEMKKPSSIIYWPKLAAIYGRHALRWAILSILIGTMLWISFFIHHLIQEHHHIWNTYYNECDEEYLCST